MQLSLRAFRKQTQLTQGDMAFLLCRKKNGGISQAEGRSKHPSLQVLILYHTIFDTPMEHIIKPHKERLKNMLLEQLPIRIQALQQKRQTSRVQSRIAHLEKTFSRLAPPQSL